MKRTLAAGLLAFLAGCALTSTAYATTGQDLTRGITGRTGGNTVDVAGATERAHREGGRGSGATSGSTARTVITLLPECPGNNPSTPRTADICTIALRGCAAANPPGGILYAIYRGIVTAGSTTWTQIGTRCANPGSVPTAPVPGLTISQVQRLPLPPGPARIQPPSGRLLINVPTNLYLASTTPTTLTTTIIGLPVRVRVTPAHYRWTAGDGGVVNTADPGAPYPDLRVTYTYRTPGNYRIALRTFYTAEYSVAAGPWLPIDGEAQVDTTPIGVTAIEARSHLVTG